MGNLGSLLRSANYTNNILNQLTSRDAPGYLNVLGSAKTNATVSLWTDTGLTALTERKNDYFRGELSINNVTGAVWLRITNLAVLQNIPNPDIVTNNTGNAILPRTPESFIYDAEGNSISDGLWTNRWDSENLLVSMLSLTNLPSSAKKRLTFTYDQQGRRISKLVEKWTGSIWQTVLSNKFAYDGWNLIAELNGTNNAIIRNYMWGLGVGDTGSDAGSVGSLLALQDVAGGFGTQITSYDLNGNVHTLVNASNGTISATYDYDPFGRLILSTGAAATTNPFRFSTKYQDEESGIIYFGFRFYNPDTGGG